MYLMNGLPIQKMNPEEGGEGGGQAVTDPPAGRNLGPEGEGGVKAPAFDEDTPIPDQWRQESHLKDIKTFGDLKKSHLNAQTMVGKDRVAIPGENATPEEREAFYSKLGRPEAPDKYNYASVKFPEGVQPDPQMATKFSQIFHQAGVTQKQAETIYSAFNEHLGSEFMAGQEHLKQQLTKWDEQTKKDFGSAYDEMSDLGERALAKADPETVQLIKETHLGRHPGFRKLMADMGKLMAEHNVDSDPNQGPTQYTLTPAQAIQEINQLKLDKDFTDAYTNKRHPGHTEAVERMFSLNKLAYPDKRE